jgi:polyisoprenoid-binding protein YceI
VIAATGAITALNNFSFSMNVRDLNSEHRAMDENCYKALRSDQYPAISYNCGVTAVVPAAGGYTISSKGKLSIGGVTREVAVAAVCSVAADKSITCSGSYKLKMTDYNVTPPGIMFGAIKTGNEVTIKFSFIVRPG